MQLEAACGNAKSMQDAPLEDRSMSESLPLIDLSSKGASCMLQHGHKLPEVALQTDPQPSCIGITTKQLDYNDSVP